MNPTFYIKINEHETVIIANADRMELNTHEVLLFNKKELVAVFPKHSFKFIYQASPIKYVEGVYYG